MVARGSFLRMRLLGDGVRAYNKDGGDSGGAAMGGDDGRAAHPTACCLLVRD